MPCLLIADTCGLSSGLAIATWMAGWDDADEITVLAERTLPGRETQERLMIALQEVLQESSLQAGDLDVLAVVVGPGSFTGVRIGLAAIKGLAEALGKPVVAVSRLAVLAAQAGAANATAWIDAGRGDVFAGRYRDGTCLGEAMLHGADALAAVSPSDTVVLMEDGLPEPPQGAVRVPPVGVRKALPLAVAHARAGQFADIALLDANYLRVPDAELARQARALAETSAQ